MVSPWEINTLGYGMNLCCLLPAGGMPASTHCSRTKSSSKASNKHLQTDLLKTDSNQSMFLGSLSISLRHRSLQTLCTSCCLSLFPLQKNKAYELQQQSKGLFIVLLRYLNLLFPAFVMAKYKLEPDVCLHFYSIIISL